MHGPINIRWTKNECVFNRTRPPFTNSEYSIQYTVYSTAGEHFWGRVSKLSTNFEEIFSLAHGKFEGQNKVLESSLIIINYCIIILVHIIIV